MAGVNLSLVEAFGKFGATPVSRLRGLSAIAPDGAIVLTCSPTYFAHPARGVFRYEDKLSRDPADTKGNELLGQHLALARDGQLPIRMIMRRLAEEGASETSRRCHVRPDLVGKLVKFDGDHFVVDFTRILQVVPRKQR